MADLSFKSCTMDPKNQGPDPLGEGLVRVQTLQFGGSNDS